MHQKTSSAVLIALSLLVGPGLAYAHGHTSFEINEMVYSFTVGSLNEPVAVDDKTGVDLRVESMTHRAHESGEEHAGNPVIGFEKTLKVELIAGDKKKTLDFSTVFGTPGAYKAVFIPTVQTTYGYRVFGTIDNVPFDYTWECNPAGHPATPEDKNEVEVSPGVMRLEKAGAFGCPMAKADLGFPEQSVSIYDLNATATAAMEKAKTAKVKGLSGIVLGLIALVIAVKAYKRKPTL